jgi:hypothetical protein
LSIFALYAIITILMLPFLLSASGIVRSVFLALLLANVRATFISAKHASAPRPLVAAETFGERLSDRLPAQVWPWAQWRFYALAAVEIPVAVWVLVKWAQRSHVG